MRDLIRPDPSISPREIFARMQGAWLEPRIGSMWQENTGVTPTVSGGQTIGKLVDLSAARVASQATAANRPTLQFNGNLPLIRFDSNDVLTASLPNLGSGVFSSAGSVYFATSVGMSCLHNQSIDTSYNLPALQTDNYCTVITPARLAPPLEQRLALYMHRLAGLADADFFWQEDYGPELMTNGDFSNGTTGWLTATFASISAVSGKLRVTNGAAFWGYAYQIINTTAGKLYQMQVNATLGTALKTEMSAGTDPSSSYNLIDINNPANIPYRFFASSSQTRVALWAGSNVSGQYSDYDNISVREVLDGQVGQLLADDNDTILLRA